MITVKEALRHSWQFILAACILSFIACAQLPVTTPRDPENTNTQVQQTSSVPAASSGVKVDSGSAAGVADQRPAAGQGTDSESNSPPAEVPELVSSIGTVDEAASDTSSIDTAIPSPASSQNPLAESRPESSASVINLCNQIGSKLGSVSIPDCQKHGFLNGGGHSVNGRPLVIKELMAQQPQAQDFKVLIMGGIHGDEYASISILFKWLDLYSPDGLESEFNWRFAPLVNPDGLLDGQAKRQNANGVDLNRNFPSQDWNASAVEYWQQSTGSNPRRFPGSNAASEPEVQWLVSQIEDFQPDVIVSLHAPYHLLDFDGPSDAPDKIGELYLHQLGVYPGSLGNYAGLNKRIPVVTLELPSAGIMPPDEQIRLMWRDLVAWLDKEGRKGLTN